VASPGFVARRGKAGDYVMRHSRRASGPGAADCSVTNSFATNAVLAKELWVVDICNSASATRIVGSQIYSRVN